MSNPRTQRTGGEGTPPSSAPAPTVERNLGQRRAQRAWSWVQQAKSLGEDYANLARKLPSMLQVSGLGQTLAYLYGKGYEGGRPNFRKAEGRLLEQLGAYLSETQKRQVGGDPMEVLLSLKPAEYRAATREVVAVAQWLKRFAEGQLAKGSSS